MQTKSIYTVGLLIFFWLSHLQSQITSDSLAIASATVIKDSVAVDSITQKPPTLLDKVKYTAVQYVRINRKENKLYLYDQAELYYQDMQLRAGIIVLDYAKNEVTAGRIPDSLGKLIQTPYFKQINNEIFPDSLRFNFDTQKALIWNSKSAENGMNVYAAYTKKENDSVYYIKDAKVTTGVELESSDYYFRIRKRGI